MNNLILVFIITLSSSLFSAELIKKRTFKSNKSPESILKKIKEKESKGAYIVKADIHSKMTFQDLEKKHLSERSWYPRFCEKIVSGEKIRKCAKELKNKLPSSKFSYLYINGDKNSSDFKVIHLLFSKKNKKTHYKLTIQDERDY